MFKVQGANAPRFRVRAIVSGVVGTLAAAAMSVGLAGSVASQEGATPLRVGITPIAPFGGNPPGGFYFDLMNAAAERADLELQFQPMPYGELTGALTSGAIDIIAGPFTPSNSGRAQGLAFTAPVIILEEALIVPDADGADHVSLADFAGQSVGALAGTTPYIAAIEAAGATAVTYAVPADAVAALESGEIAAFLQSRTQFAYAQEVQGLFPGVRIVDGYKPTIVTPVGVATRADDPLVGTLHAAFEALKADGTVEMLAAKWVQIAAP